MEQHYLINNKVLFNTAESVLIDTNNPSLKVTLNRPIARCLQLLIMNKGKITSQKEFFEFVWRSHGATITANTYYQNISILRRSLAQMGLGDEIIKTVSRKGLMLSQASEAIAVSPDAFFNNAPVDELLCSAEQGAPDENQSEIPAEIPAEIAPGLKPDEPVIPAQYNKKNKNTLLTKITFFVTLLLAVLAGTNWYFKTEQPYRNQFSDYTFIENIKECKVYSNHKFSVDDKLNLNEKILECNSVKNIYLTYFYFSPNVFLLSCENVNAAKAFSSCISYYYIGGLDEV